MKYFKFDDFFRSGTAKEKGIINYPDNAEELREVKSNIELLVDRVLDPLRERVGFPILICSGYRCKELNKIVGGSKKSQHLTGQAADILGMIPNSNIKLAEELLSGDYFFDQAIFERYNRDKLTCLWIHISYNPGHNRNDVLLYYNGKYRKLTCEEIERLKKDIKERIKYQN